MHDGLDRVNGCFLRVGLVYHSKHVTKFDARRVDGGLCSLSASARTQMSLHTVSHRQSESQSGKEYA